MIFLKGFSHLYLLQCHSALGYFFFFFWKEKKRKKKKKERRKEKKNEREKERGRERGRENGNLTLLPRLECSLKMGIKNLFNANKCA